MDDGEQQQNTNTTSNAVPTASTSKACNSGNSYLNENDLAGQKQQTGRLENISAMMSSSTDHNDDTPPVNQHGTLTNQNGASPAQVNASKTNFFSLKPSSSENVNKKCWCNCNNKCWCPCHQTNTLNNRTYKKARLSPRSDDEEEDRLIFFTPRNSDKSLENISINEVTKNRKRNMSTTSESWYICENTTILPKVILNEPDCSNDIIIEMSSLDLQANSRQEKFQAEKELNPAALDIWRQARASRTNQAKARARSSFLKKMADNDTLPLWSINHGKLPQYIEPFLENIVDLRRHQAQETVRMLSALLTRRAEVEDTKSRALLHTVKHLIKDDDSIFQRAEDNINYISMKDRQYTTTIMEKQMTKLQAERVTNDLLRHDILNPIEVDTPPPATNQSAQPKSAGNDTPTESMNEQNTTTPTPEETRDRSPKRDWAAAVKGRGQRNLSMNSSSSRGRGPRPGTSNANTQRNSNRGSTRRRSRSPLPNSDKRVNASNNNDRSELLRLTKRERELINAYRR